MQWPVGRNRCGLLPHRVIVLGGEVRKQKRFDPAVMETTSVHVFDGGFDIVVANSVGIIVCVEQPNETTHGLRNVSQLFVFSFFPFGSSPAHVGSREWCNKIGNKCSHKLRENVHLAWCCPAGRN